MSLRQLPTAWNLYNLRGSPFFQGTLEQTDGTTRPLELFVGRTDELAGLRRKVHGSIEGSSRQTVAGEPGVGKTTLVQQLKAQLLADGFLTADDHVQVLPNDDTAGLFSRILGALYEIILVNRPNTAEASAMRDAELLVRVTKLGTGGANLTMMGFGGGLVKGTTISTPQDILIDGPRILRDLLRLVRESDGRGVVLHLNNLENLSESQANQAADVFRSLRDLVFMHDGLHTIVVGTTGAVALVVNQHRQLRSVFDTLVIDPLAETDVHQMLTERYRYLRLDPDRDAIPPVATEAVDALYTMYRGDLRGLLKALDDGVGQVIGLRLTVPAVDANTERPAPAGSVVAPLTLEAVSAVLRQRYMRDLDALPEQVRIQQLRTWGSSDPSSVHTQASLGTLWGVTQGSVSAALNYLVSNGYVIALPRSNERVTQYALSGTSRLIFG